jgi:DNA-binding NtrC family response regulator
VEQAVKRAMREAGGRVGQAAEALGITRQALSRHLRILGLKAADFRPGSPPEKT